MDSLFLRRKSPALIGLHLFGTSLLQHPGRASIMVSGSGEAKKGILYLSGAVSSNPIVPGLSQLVDTSRIGNDGGPTTRWVLFFHCPLLHRMSK